MNLTRLRLFRTTKCIYHFHNNPHRIVLSVVELSYHPKILFYGFAYFGSA